MPWIFNFYLIVPVNLENALVPFTKRLPKEESVEQMRLRQKFFPLLYAQYKGAQAEDHMANLIE